jgi:FdhD protein
MNLSQSKKIIRIKEENKSFEDDEVAIEFELTLIINGEKFVKLICTPNDLEELVIGYMYTEGIIESINDIKQIDFRSNAEDSGDFMVDVVGNLKYSSSDEETTIIKTITTACGNSKTFRLPVFNHYNINLKQNKIEFPKINVIMKDFNKKSELFLNTGGVHTCALTDLNELLYFCEDIGRHNAVDKIIGKSIKNGIDLNNYIIITSGRISSEIVYKCLAAGIYTIISRSAPTTKAIEIGDKFGMTIIGFARGSRLNVYTCLNQYS